MAQIFCTKKLSDLIGKSVVPFAEVPLPIDRATAWNANLFSLKGKKCIIFINKATGYSCFRLGVQKKELADLNAFFQNCLERQVIADQLLDVPLVQLWLSTPGPHPFFTTDNDKKILGRINDVLNHVTHGYAMRPGAFSTDLDVEYGSLSNDLLMGGPNYVIPLNEVRNFVLGSELPPNPTAEDVPQDGPENTFQMREVKDNEDLSEIVKFSARNILQTFCDERVPYEYQDQVRYELRFEGDSAILTECRADWMGGPDWTRLDLARFRYNPNTVKWTLYWYGTDNKWHLCSDIKPMASLPALVIEMDADNTGRFWG